MSNSNAVAKLNEFCQKQKLDYAFEKHSESGMSHNKTFRMKLTISKTPKQFIVYFGEGNSLKTAKNDAAQKAFETDIIQNLKEAICTSSEIPSKNKEHSKADVEVKKLVTQLNSFSFGLDELSKTFEVWKFSQANNLKMTIDFVNIRKGISHTKTSIKLNLGNQSFKGKGSNDIEAIENAAEQIKIDEISVEDLKKDFASSSDDDSPYRVVKLHELHQELSKELEFANLAQLGPAQEPLFIAKCKFGDLTTYGLGKNKKSTKNISAFRMLKKLNQNVEIENVKTNMCNLDRWKDSKTQERIKEILYSNENAISILEQLDKIRFERTLKFVETRKEIGVQTYYTAEAKLLHAVDLKVKLDDFQDCVVKKNDLCYLKTSSKSTKKKSSKMEAAEKMVNLLKGEGPFTNEEMEKNQELKKFKEETFKMMPDKVNVDRVSKDHQMILAKIISKSKQFMADKPNYDPDFDYLSELTSLSNKFQIQDFEFEYRNFLKLEVCSSNEVYKLFSNTSYEPFVNCIINFNCGIIISAHAKSDTEIESKNKASYEVLKKLVNLNLVFQ